MADLAALRQRLGSGISRVLQQSREASSFSLDRQALADPWPQAYLDALAGIRAEPWNDPTGPTRAITDMSDRIRGCRSLLIAVLLNPVEVLSHVESLLPPSGSEAVDSWIGMYWVAEAAWDAVGRGLPPSAGYAAGETELLRPLAARLWFLVGSEPMRARARDEAWWTSEQRDLEFSRNGLLDRALGEDSWHQVADNCRAARRAWADCLNGYQSYAYLSQASPAELERELAMVIFRDGHRGMPLSISDAWLDAAAPLNAGDRAIIDDVSERHLLPRFDLRSVAALALYDDNPAGRFARRALAAAALAAGLGATICVLALLIHQATAIAAGFYLLIALGVVVFGPEWAAPWLLRMPAAAAIGVIALVSIFAGGWQSTPLHSWAAAVALAGAAFGYLVVEVRNHGVERAALSRSLTVAAVGAAQSLMVSLIGMVAIAPAFAAHGLLLARLWDRPGYGHAGAVLLLATAWCLAVGVFSQILWDDRPITAPLAHVSWRSRR